MAKPVFRNPGLVQRLPIRDFIRDRYPQGTEGFVSVDLDLVLRVFGANFATDGKGKLMLIELKWKNAGLEPAQIHTFRLMDELMRLGDPTGERYYGFHKVGYWHDDDEKNWRWWLDGKEVSQEEFDEFMLFRSDRPGLWKAA